MIPGPRLVAVGTLGFGPAGVVDVFDGAFHKLNVPGAFVDPNAGALAPSITTATMYPYALSPDETSKRILSPDDKQGICDAYPPNRAAAA